MNDFLLKAWKEEDLKANKKLKGFEHEWSEKSLKVLKEFINTDVLHYIELMQKEHEKKNGKK